VTLGEPVPDDGQERRKGGESDELNRATLDLDPGYVWCRAGVERRRKDNSVELQQGVCGY